jgi:LysR family transcriptional regulator, hydrogen peroxide-inducible genes activator
MVAQPTLKQLKYLSSLAEHRHFGNAARACHVSQSTLSAGIQELEEVLGVTLVERRSKNAQLTAVGEEVLRRAQSILIAMDDLVEVTRTAAQPLSTRLRLGVIPTIAPFLLPRLVKLLQHRHPGFQLFIREDLSEHLVETLHRGDLDVLLLALPYPADNVETLHLFYDNFLLGYCDNDELDRAPEIHTRDLKGRDLLLLEDGHCLREHALDACKLSTRDVKIPYQATSLNTIVQMVANGIGITLLPQMAVNSDLLTGTPVKTRQFAEKKVWRSIGLMWRKQTPRRDEFELLGSYIKQIAS